MARSSRLTAGVWFKIDERTDELYRLVAEQRGLDNAEVGRAAFAAGLPLVPGYDEAVAAYERGDRAERAEATGGHRSATKAA